MSGKLNFEDFRLLWSDLASCKVRDIALHFLALLVFQHIRMWEWSDDQFILGLMNYRVLN